MRKLDLELDLLRAFVAVAQSSSFTEAAEMVGRSQSAVSQKIHRLEQVVGKRVFERTSRSIDLTRDGEQLLVAARQMLAVNDAAIRRLREAPASGSLRLGVSEDFVPDRLPGALAHFNRVYPEVSLDLMIGLSCDLLAAYDDGRLDCVIAKKDGRAQRGRVIWREPVVWLAAVDHHPDLSAPARLVMIKPPCTYRELMIRHLDDVRRDWTPVCTANSLSGVQAAVAGGLGVSVLGRSFVQAGLRILDAPTDWPLLPLTEIVLLGEEAASADLLKTLVAFLTDRLALDRTLS